MLVGNFKIKVDMKRSLYIVLISLLFVVSGCKEEGRLDHIDMSAPAPEQIYDITMRATAGGAVLKYKMPKDENLLYVKAVYQIETGAIHTAKASCYEDSLVLEGFGEVKPYPIQLYSVGRNEKESAPVTYEVTPLTPAYLTAFEHLELKAGFGGVSVSFKNPDKAALAIVLMGDTANTGEYTELETFYTEASMGSFPFRGLKEKESKFAVYLRDRWEHYSGTKEALLTPLYEEVIPKNKFKNAALPTDMYEPVEGNYNLYAIEQLWDGVATDRNKMFATTKSAPIPQWFTVDLGRTATISRVKLHQRGKGSRGEIQVYSGSNVRKFELYGSMAPNPNGDWDDSWIPLGTFVSNKPSGEGTTVTEEDHQYACIDGVNYDLEESEFAPDPFVPVRYLRFKVLETYMGQTTSGSIWISELDVFGQEIK